MNDTMSPLPHEPDEGAAWFDLLRVGDEVTHPHDHARLRHAMPTPLPRSTFRTGITWSESIVLTMGFFGMMALITRSFPGFLP